jgi:hypothetical protein
MDKAIFKQITLPFLAFLFFTALTYAAYVAVYRMPMVVTVPALVEIYVEGTRWENGSTIDWGTCPRGGNVTKALDIYNLGGVPLNVSITTENLPTDWTLTYSGNKTVIPPSSWLYGNLTLTVSVGAGEGVYNWTAYLRIEEWA